MHALNSFFLTTSCFQSQEVTYAELTMPRNKGYAPMRQVRSGLNTDVSPFHKEPNLLTNESYVTGLTTVTRRPSKPNPPPRYTCPPGTASQANNTCSPSSSTSTIQGEPVEFYYVLTRRKNIIQL